MAARLRALALWLGVLAWPVAAAPLPSPAKPAEPPRLIAADNPTLLRASAHEAAYVKRVKAVDISAPVIDGSQVFHVADRILLNLFEDAAYTAVVRTLSSDTYGTRSMGGSLEQGGVEVGSFLLTVGKGGLLGTVRDTANDKLFRIRCNHLTGLQSLVEFDVEALPGWACGTSE